MQGNLRCYVIIFWHAPQTENGRRFVTETDILVISHSSLEGSNAVTGDDINVIDRLTRRLVRSSKTTQPCALVGMVLSSPKVIPP